MQNPTAAMLVIGDEILSGRTADTNSNFLALELTNAAIDLKEVRVVSDDRDAIIAHLRASGVGCSNYFVPIHMQPYIMETLDTKPGDFPLTERLSERTIALPFFANLTASQVARIKEVLKEAIAQCPQAAS